MSDGLAWVPFPDVRCDFLYVYGHRSDVRPHTGMSCWSGHAPESRRQSVHWMRKHISCAVAEHR